MLKLLKGLLNKGEPKAETGEPPPLDDVKLPFEFVVVHGKEALGTREKLLQRGDVTPVIMGNPADVELVCELILESTETTEAIIAKAAELDVGGWIRDKLLSDPEYYKAEEATWPKLPVPQAELSVHLEVLTRLPKKSVLVGLVPTREPWKVPAYLRYGDWNDCPSPAVHVALHRKWADQYGATIACVSSDVIECTVANPPTSREDAMKLAFEQFAYCGDIVHQGVGSVTELAATLLGGKTWYFWWD
jgi:hypothetical protein